MKNVGKFLGLITLLFFVFTSCEEDKEMITIEQAQTTTPNASHRSCGMKEHMAELFQNQAYRKTHEARLQKALAWNSIVQRATCNTPIRVPVAVHYQGVSNPDANCLVQLAQSQIDVLNQDYQATNSDIGSWTNTAAAQFPGISNGASCIEFILATKNHPSGYGLSNGNKAVTINKTTGDSDNKWAGYLNIFVKPNTGVLGYSPLGGSGNGDGVVVDANAFGKGSGCGSISPNAPYNLGRTLTHELGHYLLLDHIWGNGCSQDDGVSDTPNSQQEYYGCPNLGVSSCNSNDMFMNYMDYVNDACMYMFSAGQVTRMENYLNNSLSNIVNNASNVLDGNSGGGGSTPTCNDGIKNGDETGVDCGGSCPACPTTPTCNDGIQNGTETGVDCGGNCSPCPTNDVLDLGISSIIAPVGTINQTTVQGKVRLKNYGNVTVTTAKIRYRYNSEAIKSFTWNGTLTPGATTDVNLPNRTFSNGNHTIIVHCKKPNGLDDTVIGNDKKTGTFTIDSNNDNGGGTGDGDNTPVKYLVQVKPDQYGSEINWELYDDKDNIVATGGSYADGDTKVKTKAVFLKPGCYTFVIYDSYGDGICCEYGTGWYRVKNTQNQIIVAGSGDYGYFSEATFCTGSNQRLSQDVLITKDEKRSDLPSKK